MLRILEGKRVRSDVQDHPQYELIAIHGRREFHTHSKSWKNKLDDEDKEFWNSPDFEHLNGRNAFIFKYVVGVHSSPLRLILAQRMKDNKLDILGQCVMKFPKMPLLNRSIRLTHPIGVCKRDELLATVGLIRDGVVGQLCDKITGELSGPREQQRLGDLKYKCIILQRPFLKTLLVDENCYTSHPGILAKHVFVRFFLSFSLKLTSSPPPQKKTHTHKTGTFKSTQAQKCDI